MDVGTYIDRLAALDFRQIAVECMKSNEPILWRANIDQLIHGIKSTGKPIGKYRNDAYAAKKNRMNPEAGPGNVDLLFKRDFSRGIFFKFTADSIISDSNEKHYDGSMDLLEAYGDDVLGILMTEKVKNDLQPEFIAIVKNKIAL